MQGYSTSAVAFAQLPFLICFGVAGIYAGRWMGPGRRTLVLMASGSLALVLGLALFAIVQVQTPYWQLLPALMLAGLGLAQPARLDRHPAIRPFLGTHRRSLGPKARRPGMGRGDGGCLESSGRAGGLCSP